MASGIIEGYHLSPQQKQLWAHQKEAGWVPAWILLRIEGTVSPQRIVEAIDTLRQRHETLRTDFHTLAGVAFPLQVIGEGAMDSSHGPLLAEEVRARVDVEVEALRAALTSGKPRVHARVWTVSDALTYLWLGGPRFYFDARSLLLLRNELVELLQEREGALGLPLQYADYAQWHRDLLEDASSPEGARGLAFWHEERLAEGTRLCNDRTAERRGAAARACVSMERGLGEALLACCAKLGVAPSALLACAWTSLCARTFDAADLLLAYRCEEQMEQALAGCVGPLAVSMPLRLTLDLQTPFSRSACAADERLRRARVAKDWLWTMPGASNVRPSIGFSFIEAQDAGAAELRVSVESLRALGTDAMLDACCVRHGSNIALSIDYDTDCVAVAEAETLLRRFVMLLEQLLAEPELAVGSVNLLTESEIDELMRLGDGGRVDVEPRGCLHELFHERARRSPDSPAVACDGEGLTFGALEARSNRLARRLRELQVQREEPVVLCAARSTALVEGALGIWKAGGAMVAIDIDDPDERVIQLAVNTGARFALVAPERVAVLERSGLKVLVADEQGWVQGPLDLSCPPSVNVESDLAYIMYTSGSTGEPRGVEVEHRSVLNLLTALKHAVYGQECAGLRVSLNAPLSFDASIKQLVMLLEGACVQIVPAQVRGDGDALLHFLQNQRIDVFDCTPSQLKLLVAAGLLHGGHAYPRTLLVGGEAIEPELWSTLAGQKDRACYDVYGPTECTVDSTIGRITADRAPHIGRPICNASVYLLDDCLKLVPRGTVGEVVVAGAGLARGYLGRSDLTAASFPTWVPPVTGAQPQRVYRTGDLARYRDDGSLEFVGRRDEQIKIRGVRMELGEIANVARRHPLVRDAAMIVRSKDQQLICYVVAKDPSSGLSPLSVREHLAAWLPPTMVPTHAMVVDCFPLTDNGKLDKARLPTTAGLRPELKVSYAVPQGRAELAIAKIWRAVLGLDDVGVLDNFFDLGGHSLLLPQVQTAMESELQVTVTLPQLIEFPTIQALVRHLEGERGVHAVEAAGRGNRQRAARARLKRRLETEGQLE